MLDGVTLVVSPLIALMKDQVDALAARDIPTTFINSSLGYAETNKRLSEIRRGIAIQVEQLMRGSNDDSGRERKV